MILLQRKNLRSRLFVVPVCGDAFCTCKGSGYGGDVGDFAFNGGFTDVGVVLLAPFQGEY